MLECQLAEIGASTAANEGLNVPALEAFENLVKGRDVMVRKYISGSLKNGIHASVALPALIAIILAITLLSMLVPPLTATRTMAKQTDLIKDLGRLVHEQQIERGATSVFLNSGGTLFQQELAAQRVKVNAAAESLRATIEVVRPSLATDTASVIEQMLAALETRTAHRASVDIQDISIPAALGHYTRSNAQMMEAISSIAAFSHNTEMAVRSLALESLLRAKEYSGIERAIGSGGFASGVFDVDRLLFLKSLIASQESGLVRFRSLATDDHLAALEAIVQLQGSQDLITLRQVAFDAVKTGDLQGITADTFFAATTERINGFFDLENRLVGELSGLAKAQAFRATVQIVGVLGALLIAALGAYLVSRFSIRSMLGTVKAIADAGDQLAGGNSNAAFPDDAPEELAAVVTSFKQFQQSVAESRAREAESAEERHKAEAQARAAQEEQQALERERAVEDAERAQQEKDRITAYAAELSTFVDACANGDFSQRIQSDESAGILAELSDGLNKISESVAHALDDVRTGLSHLAAGDLTYRSDARHQGIFAEITDAMSEATDTMSKALSRVANGAVSVSNSSEAITKTTDDLAQRFEQNATMLRDTAGAIEAISGAVGTAAKATRSANDKAADVSHRAAQTNETAVKTRQAMEDILTSSADISKILKVIDEIAFQTNLLALNAGVEAARAGDAGRGFSVVAQEVRSLAQRSARSSEDITKLIKHSEQSIAHGVKLVEDTTEALRDVSEDMTQMTNQINQIASSFDETSSRLDVISATTGELDGTTQENASKLEQANNAVKQLDNEARRLRQAAGSFRLAESATPMAAEKAA